MWCYLLSDFNKENKELKALDRIESVDKRFIKRAAKFWWAHIIAAHYYISPQEVKTWDAEDVMESLAAIGITEKNMKNKMPKTPK
ncbi:hypothetical protein [Bacillus thuringiensis]|uniref:hypothetical protein n=1 Tax=Bacillus thuringiensis TaxID=1428 RepID=UPI00398784D5